MEGTLRRATPRHSRLKALLDRIFRQGENQEAFRMNVALVETIEAGNAKMRDLIPVLRSPDRERGYELACVVANHMKSVDKR